MGLHACADAARVAAHLLFGWNCLLCDGRLVSPSEVAAGLCVACADGLPRMPEPRCGLCGIGLSSEDGWCLRCRTQAEALPGVGRLRSACLYAGVGQDLVRRFKEDGGRPLARAWAPLAARCLAEVWEPGAAIVPVPALAANRRARGFDQMTALLAALPEPYRGSGQPGLLARRGGGSQKTLGRDGRRSNLEGCIVVAPGRQVPARAVLIDDVCTTGATLSVCAAALRRAGCAQVDAVTLLRD